LTDQTFGVVALAATSTPGRTRQWPARRSSPNQATTRLTLSTFGAITCSRSSATTMSGVSAIALRFSATVAPPPACLRMVWVA
jgi:hypothetical protein